MKYISLNYIYKLFAVAVYSKHNIPAVNIA